MRVDWYLLRSGKLRKQQVPFSWPKDVPGRPGEVWVDVDEFEAETLRQFLAPLKLHPLQEKHCLDSDLDPGVLAFKNSLLLEYPAAFDRGSTEPAFLTFILQASVLVTIRRGPMPTLDDLIRDLTGGDPPLLHHLPELIYLILDQFSDVNVGAQISVRDQIQRIAQTLDETPNAVEAKDLTSLRRQVGSLISLMENQLYCVSRLAAADIEALREPHRKAYVQDLVSEAEIAQRGAYRLETRVSDLFRDYQMVGSDRVEKRLRLLTIVSAITLPLGLIAGLLGMNVGGVPGIGISVGFTVVVVSMILIALAEYAFFKSKGWFD